MEWSQVYPVSVGGSALVETVFLGGLAAGDEVLSRVGGNRKSCDHSGIRDNFTSSICFFL